MTEEDKNPLLYQITRSGYLPDFISYEQNGMTLLGVVDCSLVDRLKEDRRFANGVFYLLHRRKFDPGAQLTEFRSYNGTLGKGSLQLVIAPHTGVCYADIDRWNPYADLVSIFGHLFLEMVPNWFRRKTRTV